MVERLIRFTAQLARFGRNRRLARDFEAATASVMLLIRRIARSCQVTSPTLSRGMYAPRILGDHLLILNGWGVRVALLVATTLG